MTGTNLGGRLSAPRRSGPPIEIVFPVTPMLDMAFQLMAFFVLTFQSPSSETRLDLHLPTSPAALPGGARGAPTASPSRRADLDIENDLVVRVESDGRGAIRSIALGESTIHDLDTLGDRLRRYAKVLGDRPLRVRLVADDRLLYENAARIVGIFTEAGVGSIRLAEPPVEGGRRP